MRITLALTVVLALVVGAALWDRPQIVVCEPRADGWHCRVTP